MIFSHAEFIAYARFSERAHPNFGTRVSVAIPTSDILINVDLLSSGADTLALILKLDGLRGIVAVFLDVHDL
jgi:hypothetical protein